MTAVPDLAIPARRAGTPAPRALTVAQVQTLPVDRIIGFVDDNFLSLVTVAIADATCDLAAPVRHMLRSSARRLDWLDALLWAEGELLVAVERTGYRGTANRASVAAQLRAVRTRITEVNTLIRKDRRAHWRDSPAARAVTDADFTARKWLSAAFPDEFKALLAEVMSAHGITHWYDGSARDIYDAVAHGHTEGWLTDPITPEVRRILNLSDQAMRQLVVTDATEPDDRVQELCHPLVLRRWDRALNQLAEQTYRRAGAAGPRTLGSTPKILTTASAKRDRARANTVLRARRFLAAILQRRIECRQFAQQAISDIDRARQQDPGRMAYARAKNRARHLLAERRPAEFAIIRAGLRPYERTPGVIDTDLLPDDDRRGAVKRALVAAARHAASHPKPAPLESRAS